MPDPIDDGREALDRVEPTRDLWAEATARAAADEVVPLAPVGARSRRGVWLAAAAVVALVAGTIGVLAMDDDPSVNTGPAATPDDTTTTTLFDNGTCSFGVSGDPIVLEPGPADPPLIDPTGQPDDQLVAHTALGSQIAEIHVPGVVVTDLVGERVEDIQLRRGTAQVWFAQDFVQVRWFPGGADHCGSFTVTVAGSTEDGNRHAAVDLAERILVPADLAGDQPADVAAAIEGDWQLETSTVAGQPTDGGGLTFSFLDGDATWTDGCNTFGALYEADGPTLHLGEGGSTEIACPTNPTSQAVQAVMGSDEITVRVSQPGGPTMVLLTAGDVELLLRRSSEAGS